MTKQPLNSKNKKDPKGSQETIESLSYEESLQKLETILDQLRNDQIPIEKIQKYYLDGKRYLDHCESLLNNLEKSVTELDLEDNIEESNKN